MDRNSAIGLTLIAALLFAYFYWFAPTPQPAAQTQKPVAATQARPDSTVNNTPESDSLITAAYGDLSSVARGTEEETVVENNDVRIVFSNRGGIIKRLELKKYSSYQDYKKSRQQTNVARPLTLIAPERSHFTLMSKYQGKDVDLYNLYYKAEQRKSGDTTVVTFTIPTASGTLTQSYFIPKDGYQIGYGIHSSASDVFTTDNLVFQWEENIRPIEKDLQDTRIYSTVTYSTPGDGFDELAQRSTSNETKVFTGPVQWVTIKQKFFLASIIAKNNFSAGEVGTIYPTDSSSVKLANVKLLIPKSSLSGSGANFKFYIGPNDYNVIGDVADHFRENINLGWPPVHWINKYVIFPVFHFLTGIISNYGLIIVVLVLLLKLVLAPLSYRSYLSMAKMKVLKPELDEIKEKNGDDMQKVQAEQLKLYQQVGVNPISGCVPVLLQMPILFAMFYLFPASIELRQQPFLWAEDLSTYDSLIHLPFRIPFGVGDHISLFTLLMTASTLIYTWQNNQLSSAQGPMKAMSYVMPVIFFFVLNSFSAGLTFYYLVSNLVTFAQQAIIRRFVDDDKIKLLLEENRKKNLTGTGKKSKFMTKLEDAMKASEEARKRAEEERRKRK